VHTLQAGLSQAVPMALILGSVCLAGRTPGMAALGLQFRGFESLEHVPISKISSNRHKQQLASFAFMYAVLPELYQRIRRSLIMRGCSMPNAAAWQRRTWALLRTTERSASAARLVNLVRLATSWHGRLHALTPH
jgi:hypothetical protein